MRVTRWTAVAVVALGLCGQWAGAAEPAFVRHFGAGHKQLVAINDPLPLVQRLLTSPGLRKVLVDGRLGKAIRALEPTTVLDPLVGWDVVKQNERWVPAEIAVGLDDAGMKTVDSFFSLAVYMSLGQGLATLDAAERAKEGPRVEAGVLAEVRRAQLPGARVFVRMRQQDDAAALVMMAGLQLKNLPMPPGARLTVEDKRTRVEATLGDLVEDAALRALLKQVNMVTAADSPAAIEISKVARAWRFEATLEVVENGMLLTIGKPAAAAAAAAPLKAADLGPLFRWDAADLMWSRWDVSAWKGKAAGWTNVWDQWKDTKAGEAARASDAVDMLVKIEVMTHDIAAMGTTGESRLWAPAAESALRFEVRERGLPDGADLAGSPLAKAIGAAAEGFEVQSFAGLGERAAATLGDLESRLGLGRFRAMARMMGEGADPATKALANYTANFADFRAQVMNKAPALFDPGVAWVFGTRGTVTKFDLRVEDEREKHAFAGAGLPTLEIALIGRPKDAKQAEALVRDAYAGMVKGLRLSAGAKPGGEAAADVKEADLGLGRPTFVLGGAFIDDLGKAAGAKVALQIEGDLRPHYFTVDGLLVVSTSARLSKEIVAAATGKAPAVALPKVDGRLVGCGRFAGHSAAQYLNHAAAWIKVFAKEEPSAAQVAEVLLGVGDLVDLMGDTAWQAAQKGAEQTTTGAMAFKN